MNKHSISHSRKTPLILLASCISFAIKVTLFACIQHKFASSNKVVRWDSAASCNATIASAMFRKKTVATIIYIL